MIRIFWGLIFVLVSIHIDFGASRIDLLPDFIGFFLIMTGVDQLPAVSRYFQWARTIALVMGVYSAIVFVLALFGVAASQDVLIWSLALVATAALLCLSFCIVKGLAELETAHGLALQSKTLYKLWLLLAACNIACLLLYPLPVLLTVASLATVVVSVIFLFNFYQAAKVIGRPQALL